MSNLIKKSWTDSMQELHKSNLETRFLGSNSKVNFSYAYGTQMLTQKKGGTQQKTAASEAESVYD